MRSKIPTAAAILTSLLLALTASAANPKETVGFMGSATGTVKSAQKDGSSFVLAITSAEPNDQSAVKDGKAMAGKQITLGVRMPRKDGKPTQHPDDVAWIKTLKPGQVVKVKIFAVKADPSVLRITEPGEMVDAKK